MAATVCLRHLRQNLLGAGFSGPADSVSDAFGLIPALGTCSKCPCLAATVRHLLTKALTTLYETVFSVRVSALRITRDVKGLSVRRLHGYRQRHVDLSLVIV